MQVCNVGRKDNIMCRVPACNVSDVLQVFNRVIGKMVTAVLWTSPLGIASLIAAAICRACSLLGTLSALGLWLTTVIAGLSSAPSGSIAPIEF